MLNSWSEVHHISPAGEFEQVEYVAFYQIGRMK